MDPTIALLEHCVREAKAGGPPEAYTRDQLEKMLEFTRMLTAWYSQIDRLSTPALQRLFRGGVLLANLFKAPTPPAEDSEPSAAPAE